MANGLAAPSASILDTFNNAVCGLEEAMLRLNESMLNEPPPSGIAEAKGLATFSRKLNALHDLISRIDCVTASINQAAADLSKL